MIVPFIIVETDDKTFTAYAETGEKICSDIAYADCLIKVGLIGIKMEPLSPNSFRAERALINSMTYGWKRWEGGKA